MPHVHLDVGASIRAPEVMLCSTRPGSPQEVLAELERDGKWLMEAKWDGVRAVVRRSADSTVVITNRQRVNITARFPEVVAELAAMSFVGVLDGEIVVIDITGRPSFELALRRNQQSRASRIRPLAISTPARFVPFDVLEVTGENVRGEPYTARRARLELLWPGQLAPASRDGNRMWEFVLEHAMEGVVAKRADSAYVPGRHPSWVKIKSTHRLSALVERLVRGGGNTDGVYRAAELSLLDLDTRQGVVIGTVGSGLRDQDLAVLRRRLAAGELVVVEVEYKGASRNRRLREPVFRGFRDDIDPAACTTTQLH